MNAEMIERKKASRHHPYVIGYAPEDLMGETKMKFFHRLKSESDPRGPYHLAVERALEIRDDQEAGRRLPAPPASPKAAPEPAPVAVEAPPAVVAVPPVVVTMRAPAALYDRLRNYCHGARRTKHGVLVEALEQFLDAADRSDQAKAG